jgi:hypothetical protein
LEVIEGAKQLLEATEDAKQMFEEMLVDSLVTSKLSVVIISVFFLAFQKSISVLFCDKGLLVSAKWDVLLFYFVC